MNYKQTFITISPDSPTEASIIPASKGDKPTIHALQYQLLTEHPYTFNGEELLFEVHVRRLGLSPEEVAERRDELWAELFSKDHACLRASTLAKKYGWGFHFDEAGHIALYGAETDAYQTFSSGEQADIKVLSGMRSKRA